MIIKNVTRVTEWIQSIWIRFKEKTRRTNWMNVQWLTETKLSEWTEKIKEWETWFLLSRLKIKLKKISKIKKKKIIYKLTIHELIKEY